MIDRLLGGRYRLRAVLGRGGMATVYEAEDTLLGRNVAVKLLDQALSSDPEFLARFEQEARAAARLNHPNVVAVFDIGVDGPDHFMVMELVEGDDLKVLIERRAPFPPAQVIHLGIQLAEALAYAHSRGVVHRDVKPHNILVDAEERLKVTDFGIARALGTPSITRAGHVMGSVQYMAPEQTRGEATSPAADVYSAGVVLYEMATGRVPFEGPNPVAIAMQHEKGLTSAAWNGVPVPPGLRQVVDRSMAVDPAARFASAADLKKALQDSASVAANATRRVPVAAPPPPSPWIEEPEAAVVQRRVQARVPPPGSRGGIPWPAVILIGLLLFGLAALAPTVLGSLLSPSTRRDATPTAARTPTREARGAATAGATPPEPTPSEPTKAEASPTDTSATPIPAVAPPTLEATPTGAATATPKATSTPSPEPSPSASPTLEPPTVTPEPPTPEPTPTTVTVPVPALVGFAAEGDGGAVQALEAFGLKAEVQRVASDQPKGTVIDQKPAAGEPVEPGSTVVLAVSNGPATVEVPNVEGMKSADARKQLEDRGFKVSVKERKSEKDKGTVLDQNPEAGERAQPESQVEIIVAR